MKTKIILLIFICITLVSWDIINNQARHNKKAKNEITKVLKEQEKAWNNGDLESYMNGYWNSDSLKFLSNNKITHGWTNTLENYKKGYPDKDAIGKLKFTIVSIDVLNENVALMIGQYLVIRKEDKLNGYFSLVWKKINGKWVIIFDHSS